MTYETQTHALIVKPTGEPIYSEMATIVRIDDEAAGPYVVVEQHGRDDIGKIAVTHDEWPHIRDAIERMMLLCQPEKPKKALYMQPGVPSHQRQQWNGKGEVPDWMRDWIATGNDPMECLVS